MCMVGVNSFAYDCKVGGIYYNLSGDEASVTYYKYTVSYNRYTYKNDTTYVQLYYNTVTIPETITYNSTTYRVTSIGDHAFDNSGTLTSVIVPNGVTKIGYKAFMSCTAMNSMELPNTLDSIGANAFYNCSSLTAITIPSSVKAIGADAFGNDDDEPTIEEVTIPDFAAWCNISFSNMGSNPFWLGNAQIVNEDIKNGHIIIPDGVTAISSYAFFVLKNHDVNWNGSMITAITLPNSVTSIGDYAFYIWGEEVSINIPDNIISIGAKAFGCCNFTNDMPNSVAFIGEDALSGTTWYERQPKGVVYAGLLAIKYKGDMAANSIIDLRENTIGISTAAFKDRKNLSAIILPEGLKTIGEKAFSGCTGLVMADIPNTVEVIGERTFYNCQSLAEISLENVTHIGKSAFEGCKDLASLYIGNKSPKIDEHAFRSCHNLTSLVIESGKIGPSAFEFCSNLTSVTIGSGETSFYGLPFESCSKLGKVIVPDLAAWCTNVVTLDRTDSNPLYIAGHLYSDENTEIVDLKIPDGVTTINDGAFAGCISISSVTIPNSVTSLGSIAFTDCTSLTSVTIGNGVTSIGIATFRDCTGLTSIKIPNSVTKIGNAAFFGCTGLTNIIIPNSVTSIGFNAFYECTGLTSITIGNSVASIGESAFFGCTGLTSITIPNSVTSIGSHAFYGCTGLTKVIAPDIAAWCNIKYDYYEENNGYYITSNPLVYSQHLYSDENTEITNLVIPDGVQSISDLAFVYCNSITSVTIPSSVKVIGNFAFWSSGLANVTVLAETPAEISIYTFTNRKNVTLYVPVGCKTAYETTEYWNEFKEIVEMEGELTDVEMVQTSNNAINRNNTMVYNLQGKQVAGTRNGLNIIRMSDGTVRKVMVK